MQNDYSFCCESLWYRHEAPSIRARDIIIFIKINRAEKAGWEIGNRDLEEVWVGQTIDHTSGWTGGSGSHQSRLGLFFKPCGHRKFTNYIVWGSWSASITSPYCVDCIVSWGCCVTLTYHATTAKSQLGIHWPHATVPTGWVQFTTYTGTLKFLLCRTVVTILFTLKENMNSKQLQ